MIVFRYGMLRLKEPEHRQQRKYRCNDCRKIQVDRPDRAEEPYTDRTDSVWIGQHPAEQAATGECSQKAEWR